LLIAFTGIGPWWQRRIAGLSEDLLALSKPTLRWVVLLPSLAALQSWQRGVIVSGRHTQPIVWGTVINLSTLILVLALGLHLGWLLGSEIAALALTVSQTAESLWLWWTGRSVRVRGLVRTLG
jgi:Na+-driven multidrug efflux pump